MERRLAAILAADLVGYSRLIREDEAGTLAALKSHLHELIEPKVAERKGRIVKLMGDGLLAEFPSAVEAVQCAVEIQQLIGAGTAEVPENKRAVYRIGINIGDIVVEGDDIYGDGVNVAARLESLADAGGICISGSVYDQVRDSIETTFEDLGEKEVKNIDRPVRVWRWSAVTKTGSVVAKTTPLKLPNKPSIAVLPFTNMSGDLTQEYFADGMVEEIITALSRVRWLFVIARNSSFTYKGRSVDVKQVGRELGVRYVLEGSVRKAGSKVRITGQLIDASTGAHLWADRFDGALEDVFDLQDQVATSVIGAIAPRLERAEIERAKRKPTENLDAYDYYLQGIAAVHRWKLEANQEALSFFFKATELDPNFASAYGMAARCYSMRKASGWMADPSEEIAKARTLARRAAELGKDDAVALSAAGIALSFVAGELDEGAALIDQALELDPNLAWAWLFSGWAKIWLGEPEAAKESVERGMRLSPHDPNMSGMQSALASSHFFAGRFAEALSWAQAAMRAHTHILLAACIAAASAVILGEMDEAEGALDRLRELDPNLCLSNLNDLFPVRRTEDLAKLVENLRIAGLPE